MATQTRTILKGWFSRGKYPTQTQFADWIDSFFHRNEDAIGIDKITGLNAALDSKQDKIIDANPNVTQVLETIPGSAVFTTAAFANWDLCEIRTCLIQGSLTVSLPIIINKDAVVIAGSPINYEEDLNDIDVTAAIVGDIIQVTITINAALGAVTVKKPIINYI